MGRRKGSKDLPDNAKGKICPGCGIYKLFSEFSKNKNTKFGIGNNCKICDAKNARVWRAKKENRDIVRNRNLQINFGISIDDYDKLLEKQNGICAICGKVESRKNMYGIKRLAVDHNHNTGKIRGLLCSCCNQGLGMFYVDDKGVELLLNAIEYMRKNDE